MTSLQTFSGLTFFTGKLLRRKFRTNYVRGVNIFLEVRKSTLQVCKVREKGTVLQRFLSTKGFGPVVGCRL